MFGHPWAWALFTLVALGLPAFAWYWRTPPALPHLAPVPGFSLVDQLGQPLSTLELRGQVVIYDFIFTRCPDACPLLTSKAAWLQQELPARPMGGVPITLVSITVDPGYDVPEVLAAYADRYGADPARWHFLTGPVPMVRQVLDGFQALAEADAQDFGPGEVPRIAHSERFMLSDAEGALRGLYPSDEEGLMKLRHDAIGLARAGGA